MAEKTERAPDSEPTIQIQEKNGSRGWCVKAIRRLKYALISAGLSALLVAAFPDVASAQQQPADTSPPRPTTNHTRESQQQTAEATTIAVDKNSGVLVIIDADGIPLRYVLRSGEVTEFSAAEREQMRQDRQKAIDLGIYVPSQVLFTLQAEHAGFERDFTPVAPADALTPQELAKIGIEVIQPTSKGSTKLLLGSKSQIIQLHQEVAVQTVEKAVPTPLRALTIIVVNGPNLAPDYFDTQLSRLPDSDETIIRDKLSTLSQRSKEEALQTVDSMNRLMDKELSSLEESIVGGLATQEDMDSFVQGRSNRLIGEVVMSYQPALLTDFLQNSIGGLYLQSELDGLSRDYLLVAVGSPEGSQFELTGLIGFNDQGNVQFSRETDQWKQKNNSHFVAPDFEDGGLKPESLERIDFDKRIHPPTNYYIFTNVENPTYYILHEYAHYLPHFLLQYWRNGGHVDSLEISPVLSQVIAEYPERAMSQFFDKLLHTTFNGNNDLSVPMADEWLTDEIVLKLLDSRKGAGSPVYWLQVEGPEEPDRSPWIKG